jgi:pyrimidine-nucleoside phosphorylase
MVDSGEVIDLSAIHGFKADKHSTGGVGDKVTPILGPLVAAAGVRFPKLSGRGLAHTGGTLDKLESISGFRIDLSVDEFIRQVNAIGVAITGQSGELVPADGVIYGLRDVTATVDSIPLIASSVMSKKIAAGADGIVLDVKCGRGAFMHTRDDAVRLARLMVAIGEAAGRRTAAVVTSMDEPLGQAVGNALEIAEAIAVLRHQDGGGELREVCLLLGAQILVMAGMAGSIEAATRVLEDILASGAALDKLRELIRWQGGDERVADQPELLPRAAEVLPLPSPSAGYVQRVDARQVGTVVMELGAGRKVKGASVDLAVGVVLRTSIGDRVAAGQSLAEIHTNHRIPNEEAQRLLLDAFELGPTPPPPRPHVLDVIG